MVTSQHDPWGPKYSSSSDEVLQKFEDDFTTSHGNIIGNYVNSHLQTIL